MQDDIELLDDIEQFETALALDVLVQDIDIPSEPREWTDVVSWGPKNHAVIGFRYKPSSRETVFS